MAAFLHLALPIGAPATALPFPPDLPSGSFTFSADQPSFAPMKWLLAFSFLFALPVAAQADPCEGRLPSRAGETFSGVVRYVGDGDGLCIGRSADPATWIEVRLSDFNAPELNSEGGRDAKKRLADLVGGRVLDCVAVRGRNGRVVVWDRVIASCRLNGRSVGDLLRTAGGREGGN
jgi:hypothetical protein